MSKLYSDAIIMDLLPSYIDGLLSEETGIMVTEHLKNSPECMKAYEMMVADLGITSNKKRKKFKYRRRHVGRVILLSYVLFLLGVLAFIIFDVVIGVSIPY